MRGVRSPTLEEQSACLTDCRNAKNSRLVSYHGGGEISSLNPSEKKRNEGIELYSIISLFLNLLCSFFFALVCVAYLQ